MRGLDRDLKPIDYDLIQWSTLGPLLFLIYINNICKLNMNGKLFLFADDTCLFIVGCDWEEGYNSSYSPPTVTGRRRAFSEVSMIKPWFYHIY